MNKTIIFTAILSLTGCKALMKDILEIAATPAELEVMPSSEVCKHLGYAQWRSQPQAYIDAKNEAKKRIEAGEVSSEDCIVFSKMAIQSKERSAAQLDQQMQDMNRENTIHTSCVNNAIGASCTSTQY